MKLGEMNRQLPFFILAGLLGLINAQVCPPPEVLAPCTCSEERLNIVCSRIDDPNFNLREVFDRASELISDDVVFKKLDIYNVAISEIEEGTFEHLKFEVIKISGNPLKSISLKAFGATRNVTTSLYLGGNRLSNFLSRRREIFELVNGFQNLRSLSLSGNRITSIPANAFQNHQYLETLDLDRNRISYIGSKAFSGAGPKLKNILLAGNSIPGFGLPEDAFEGINTFASVDLKANWMHFLQKKSYQSLLDRAATVEVGICIHYHPFPGCIPLPLFHCDRRADWLCEKEEIYRRKLDGFVCTALTHNGDIWSYCAARKNNNNKGLEINK